MTMDDLMKVVLAIMPDAIFDNEYRTGEIVISTGLTIQDGKVVKLDDEFLQ